MILKCWSTRPCWSLDAALASLSFRAAESSGSIEVKLADFVHFLYSGYKLIVSWVLKKQILIIYPVICLQMPTQWCAIVTNPSCWGGQFLTKRDWISIARLEFMLLVLTSHKDCSNAASSYDCLKWKGQKKSAWYLWWDRFSFGAQDLCWFRLHWCPCTFHLHLQHLFVILLMILSYKFY